jgi:hypothetical protein
MKTIWHKSQSDEIKLTCPICGHQTAPPQYPYCDHTVFVLVEPSGDDAFFDLMRSDFAEAWNELCEDIPIRKAIASLNIIDSCEVWEVSESSGYYPVTVIAGYELQRNQPEQESEP